ncbi:hypothetical protein JL720_9991 [Aureococcus anophagefferens]|nr:hypothetical protein JL720_9991 [Aureococcus anophagefferens]
MAARLFAALLLLRRFDARAPGAPPPGVCAIKDQAAEWHRTPLYGKYKRLDVFVSGIEGAGHHGVVNGFLAPVVQLVTVAHRTDCDDRTEMPFFGHPQRQGGAARSTRSTAGSATAASRRKFSGTVASHRSYPSERRLHPPDRLAALYLKSCFPAATRPPREQDSPAARSAIFAYFSTWAVFDEPAQQLIPNDFRAAATRAAAAAPPSNGSAPAAGAAALAAYFYDEYWAPQRRKLDALRRRADALIDACLKEKRRRGGGLEEARRRPREFPPAALGHALVPRSWTTRGC